VLTVGDLATVPPDMLARPSGSLLEYCRTQGIDEIVIAMDDRRREFPVHELLECRLAGVLVTDIVDFLEDTMRVTRWYSDPANHDAAIKIIADATKAPAALFAGWMFSTKDYYRDPSLVPDIAAIRSNIEAQAQLGFVKGALDVIKYIDVSYVEAAKARLK